MIVYQSIQRRLGCDNEDHSPRTVLASRLEFVFTATFKAYQQLSDDFMARLRYRNIGAKFFIGLHLQMPYTSVDVQSESLFWLRCLLQLSFLPLLTALCALQVTDLLFPDS